MAYPLDFRTARVVFALIRLLPAMVLVYVRRVPRGPMRGTQWFIGGLLIVEAGVSVIRAVGAVRLDPASVLYSSPSQAIFIICIIGTSFMLGLALAILTSQRIAMLLATANARFNAAINNLSQGLALFDSEHRIVFSNEKF